MTGNIFFTGCTHFGHKNIITFEAENRPFATIEEHDDFIVEAWNKTVSDKDTIYHLGDAVFPRVAMQTLGRLNGNKILVLGNHDRHPLEEYYRYFKRVVGCLRLENFFLSHFPVNPMCLEHNEQYNIHCHIHSKQVDDSRYVNVSVEHWKLFPVSFDEVKKKVGS